MISILQSYLFYYFIYKQSLKYDVSLQMTTYLYSTIHSIIISFSTSLYLLKYINDEMYVEHVYHTMGYFLFDMTILISNYFKFKWNIILQNLFHHISGIFGIFFYAHIYTKYAGLSLISEITNPFLNYCWYCIKVKKYDISFKISIVLLLITYLIFRIFNLTYLTYQFLYINEYGIYVYGPLTILNYIWFYKLCYSAKKYISI